MKIVLKKKKKTFRTLSRNSRSKKKWSLTVPSIDLRYLKKTFLIIEIVKIAIFSPCEIEIVIFFVSVKSLILML